MKCLVLSLMLATTVNAAEYRQFYLAKGKEVAMGEALVRALRGEDVVKCQAVEAKPNKKGTSISLHNVKKRAE